MDALIEQYEFFFDNIDQFALKAKSAVNVGENKHDSSRGIVYVCASSEAKQSLYLDGDDVAFMKGRRVLIVDDVISTGQSLHALEQLVNEAGGRIVGRMAILAEGDAIGRTDITYLAPLPLFNKEGKPL